MIKTSIIILFCILFFLKWTEANSLSVLPKAQEIHLYPGEEKEIFFRVNNHSEYTQNVLLDLQKWNKEDVTTNISYTEWCFPHEQQFNIEPNNYKNIYFTLKHLANHRIKKDIKLMVMCFFSSEKKNQSKQKSLFIIKPRVGVAIYVHHKDAQK